jgi:hypothetical protein
LFWLPDGLDHLHMYLLQQRNISPHLQMLPSKRGSPSPREPRLGTLGSDPKMELLLELVNKCHIRWRRNLNSPSTISKTHLLWKWVACTYPPSRLSALHPKGRWRQRNRGSSQPQLWLICFLGLCVVQDDTANTATAELRYKKRWFSVAQRPTAVLGSK